MMFPQDPALSRPSRPFNSYRARLARYQCFTILTDGPPVDLAMEAGGELRVERHPEKPGWLRLHLPKALTPIYLDRVRNIHGRRWDPKNKVWEIPYTRRTLRFLERQLGEAVYFTFTPDTNLPDRQEEAAGRDQPRVTLYVTEGPEVRLQAPASDPHIRERIERIFGCRRDEQSGCWWAPNRPRTLAFIRKIFAGELEEKTEAGQTSGRKPPAELSTAQIAALQKMEERLVLLRLSIHTKKSYLGHFKAFLQFFRGREPDAITKAEIEQYILKLIRRKNISASTQNGIINAIKFYYEQVLGWPRERYDISRPKKPRQLPNVLSEEEVTRLIGSVPNLKHRCILLLIYSAGLRLSELINLRVQDINVERRTIFVKSGKGKKDRYTVLADSVLPVLTAYRKSYRPGYWLFEGQDGGQYSRRSVQNIFTRARDKSGVNPFATVHTLRHSFATHCIEAGYSVAIVQQVLGHESIKTTERYLHVSTEVLRRLRSPLDNLDLDG